MIWGAMSSAGVGPLCFLKTNVTAPVYQEILEHFMLPSADQLFKYADFIFQKDLAPAHTAKSTKSWLNDHGVGVLDWPANSPDVNPIENLGSRDSNPQPWVTKGFKANALSTRPQLPNRCFFKIKNYLNYFRLCALNLFNTRVSQFELNYWNKWTFPWHSNLLRCTCMFFFGVIKYKAFWCFSIFSIFSAIAERGSDKVLLLNRDTRG